MSDLETILRDAAEADEVSFDHADVRRGMRRRQRTRITAGAVALVLVAAVGAALLGRDAPEAGVASESGVVGALTIDELTADRWVPMAYSAVTTGADGAFVEFGDDGAFTGVFGCELVSARWSVEEDELRFDDVVSTGCEDGEAVQAVEFAALLEAQPVAERFGTGDTLSLRSGDDFIAFRRFDRLGSEPTVDGLTGTWQSDGTTVAFADDGTVEVSARLPESPAFPDRPDEPCETSTRYRVEDDTIVLDDDLSNGIDCGDGGDGGAGRVFGGLPFQVAGSPRARIEGDAPNRLLWLASEFGVTYATEVPATSEAAAADDRSAKDIVESVMDDVFGVAAVTMDADESEGLTVLTLDVGDGEVVARVEGGYGSFSVLDIASSSAMNFVGPAGGDEFRVAIPEPGRLTVQGIAGDDEPRSEDVVFTETVDVAGPGLTEFFDAATVPWLAAELVTDRGPTLYLLTRR